MNTSDSNETPSFDLPQPNLETITFNPDTNTEISPAPVNSEVQSLVAELPQSSPPTATFPAQSSVPNPVPQPLPVDPALSVAPVLADASVLIEKEWVARAKAIVEQTKNDPYMQNEELNKFKADFMKKKYNKDVKVSES